MRIPIRRTYKTSKIKQKGVVAIEFAIGFMAFWMMCMVWIEMSYMSYVSAICDVTIAKAARIAKKANLDADPNPANTMYLSSFESALKDSGSAWGKLVDPEKFHATVHYLRSVDDLVKVEKACKPDKNNKCGADKIDNSPIAIYRISYDFNPTLTFFMHDDTVFTREVIVVQEYERTNFKI